MGASPDKAASIFDAAAELEDPAQRAAYLDAACGPDSALRAEVEQLLRHDRAAGSYLARPALPDPAGTADHPAVAERPGTVIGPYKLLEQIGEGGFGVVFMAEQQHPVRRKIGLKVLKPGMDSHQVVARFEAERQALALMDHPNIAKVLDAGESATGRPYFVMDLVRGLAITAYCDQAQLDPRQRLDLFVSVCRAVQHAHQKGIIHRDIKPSNVLVTLNDGTPVVKVIDFGIAKATGQQLTDKTLFTGFAQMIGTPLYMSPEQAALSNIDVDTRSDIYSLGILLYELLTGTTPLEKERLKEADYDELRRLIREEEPPKPSTRISTLGQAATTVSAQRKSDPQRLSRLFRGELDWIVMKALEKDRNRRYETASAFALDVERYLHDEPVLACPPSKAYRFRKFARKYRKLLATAAAFAVLLLAATGVSLALAAWGFRAEQQAQSALDAETVQRKRAQTNERKAKESEAEAKDVLNFFGNTILAAARPKGQEGGLGTRVSLRKAIDAAEPQIVKKLKDRPLAEAMVRHIIGQTYVRLGEYRLAIAQLERALAIQRTKLGPDHTETLRSMNNLAIAYFHLRRVDKALPLFEEQLRIKEAKLGPDHPETLTGMGNLALAYKRAGKPDRALPLFEKSYHLVRIKLGPDHPTTLSLMTNLAIAYGDSGRLDKALPLFDESFRRKKATLGPTHPSTLVGMMNLGMVYVDAGKLKQGLPLLADVVRLQKASLDPQHPHTLMSMHSLGGALLSLRKFAEAEPVLRECLAIRQKKEGDDWTTFDTQSMLGESLAGQKKFPQAEPLLLEGYEGMKQREGKIPAHAKSRLTDALERLVRLYEAWDKPDKAAPMRKKLAQAKAADQKKKD
jgi:serine/threonine protein kinase